METNSLTFAQPAWFLALFLVAALGGLYVWAQKRNEALLAKVVAVRLRDQLAGAVSVGRRIFKAVLILLALTLLVFALARPQLGFTELEIKQRGRDVVIAVDTSRSMLATDVTPSRLARAKLVAQDLMNLIQGDRIGLVAFAGSAFLQAPLTLDQSAVRNSLDELDTTVIPKGGTNIAAAIQQALEAFGKGEAQSRALIIITDGEELDADGIAAAKKAADLGVRIFTIGIGSAEGSLIPVRIPGGGSDFVRDAAGKPVQSRLDVTRLEEIAAAGGGFYTPLNAETAQIVFDKGILPMETSLNGTTSARQPIERYIWPLGAAIVLIMFWFILGERRRVLRAPGLAALVAIALLGMANSSPAQTSPANQDYEAGNYAKALEEYARDLQKSPDSPKLQFNTGAAAYKVGDYQQAVDHFTKSLLTDDQKLREDASYNLGNSLVRRGEAETATDKKKADWQNAIQHYSEALKLNPKNKEAQENSDLVKKLLEDLEKQEQQKKDQDQKQDQQKDQKDQKNQDQKNQQDNKDQSKDQKDQQQKDQQQDQQNKDQSKSDQDKKDDQQKSEDQKDQQNQKNQDQKNDQKNQGQQGNQQDQKDQGQKDQQDQSKDGQGKDQQKPEQKEDGQQDDQNQSSQPQGQKGDKPQPAPQPTPGEKKEGDLKPAGNQEQPQPAQPGGEGAAEAAEEKEGEMSQAQARSLLNSLRGEEERVNIMQRQPQEETLKDW